MKIINKSQPLTKKIIQGKKCRENTSKSCPVISPKPTSRKLMIVACLQTKCSLTTNYQIKLQGKHLHREELSIQGMFVGTNVGTKNYSTKRKTRSSIRMGNLCQKFGNTAYLQLACSDKPRTLRYIHFQRANNLFIKRTIGF